MCKNWRLKGWEKVAVGLGMEGMEHWEKAVGTGEIRNQRGPTALWKSKGPSAQRGEAGPA